MTIIITKSSERVMQPPHSKIILKPHQLGIVYAMNMMEQRCYAEAEDLARTSEAEDGKQQPRNNNNTNQYKRNDSKQQQFAKHGILATPVGSGKTYCVIAMVLMDNDKMNKCLLANVKATIIVVPSHLMCQWKDAIQKMTKLSVYAFEEYSDIVKMNDAIFDLAGTTLRERFLASTDIFLVSSLYYQTVATAFIESGIKCRRMVIDEADSMTAFVNSASPALVTWFVSATLLQVDHTILSSLSNLSVPTSIVLQQNSVDCDVSFIKESFALIDVDERKPIICEDWTGAVTTMALALRSSPKSSDILRAFFTCDARTVLAKNGVPYNSENTEFKVALSLIKGWQMNMELSQKRLDRGRENISKESWIIDTDNVTELSKRLSKCRFFMDKHAEALKKEALDAEVQKLVAEMIGTDNKPESRAPPQNETFSKLGVIKAICQRAHDKREKTIVFCEFSELITMIQEQSSFPFVDLELHGGTVKRMAAAFLRYCTCDDVYVLFAQSAMFSCGVNLECTNHVVFVHRVLPHIKVQVIGRAQRPGRDDSKGALVVTEVVYAAEFL